MVLMEGVVQPGQSNRGVWRLCRQRLRCSTRRNQDSFSSGWSRAGCPQHGFSANSNSNSWSSADATGQTFVLNFPVESKEPIDVRGRSKGLNPQLALAEHFLSLQLHSL